MSKLVSDENLLQFGQAFKSNLANVATSGSYVDLSNKPNLSDKADLEDSNQHFVAGDIVTTTFTDDDTGDTWSLPGGSAASTADEIIASQSYVADAIDDINSEVWTFELEDGTTVTKTVLLN